MARAGPRPASGTAVGGLAVAVEIARLVERATMDVARERFGALVAVISAVPMRIAYQYLRDARTPTKRCRTPSSRCSRTSRPIARPGRSRSGSRGFSSTAASTAARRARAAIAGSCRRRRRARRKSGRPPAAPRTDPETRLLARERRRGSPPRSTDSTAGSEPCSRCAFRRLHASEVSAMTGLNESTVRVHLFRAARKLRSLLGGKL